MESLLQKLANYHLLNYLIPGYVFLWLVGRLLRQDFFPPDPLQIAAVSYVVGVLLSTLSRSFTERMLQAIRVKEQTTYDEFVLAETRDPKLTAMNEAGDMFAALATAILFAMIFHVVALTLPGLLEHPVAIVMLMAVALAILVIAYRRRMATISRRVRVLIDAIGSPVFPDGGVR